METTMQETLAAPRESTESSKQHNLLREFTFIIFDRIKLIIPIFLAVFIFSILIAVLLPNVYQSSAKFSLSIPKSLDPLQKTDYYDFKNRVRRSLQDQKELILSTRVLSKVYREMTGRDKNSPKAVEKLREKIGVTPPKGETFEDTSVFYVSYEDKNPNRAAETAKIIAEKYLETYGEINYERTSYSHDFFIQQTQQLYEEMLQKEKELREYETKQAVALIDILNMGSGAASNDEVGPTALLTQFRKRYYELQKKLASLRIAIEEIENEMSNNKIPAILPDMEVYGRTITTFKGKVAQLQIELNDIKPRFKNTFEISQQVKQSLEMNIESLREELQRTVRAQKITAKTIEAEIAELESVIHQLKKNITETAKEKSQYDHLVQEYNIAKEAYTLSRNKQQEARLARSLNQEKQYITLVDQPSVPSDPYKPNRILLMMMGLFAGIFLGVAVALTLDHFDHSIKHLEDIENYLGIAPLGSVSALEIHKEKK